MASWISIAQLVLLGLLLVLILWLALRRADGESAERRIIKLTQVVSNAL